MIVQMPKYSEQLLSEFAQKEWGKAKAYLTNWDGTQKIGLGALPKKKR